MNRRAAGDPGPSVPRPGSTTTCSPATPRTSLDVASTWTQGAAVSTPSITSATASMTCSQLSTTSNA